MSSSVADTLPATAPTSTTRQRNRAQLSCTHCRHAKLKCDRNDPCSQCVKKGRASQCSFPAPIPRKRKPAVSMQDRLRHLESLVKDVMTSQKPKDSGSAASNPAHTDDTVGTDGQVLGQQFEYTQFEIPSHLSAETDLDVATGAIVEGKTETAYVGATHWAAILQDIEEVKGYFNEEDDSMPESYTGPDTSLILNSHPPMTKEELLRALPERAVVDQLTSRYFLSNSQSKHILHVPSFQTQYRNFWKAPNDAPLVFLALLYVMMFHGAFVTLHSGDGPTDIAERMWYYRRCCAQSLILSNYTQPRQYTIETLFLYIEGEFRLSESDDQVNCYLLMGVVVRLALRMGLHRDPTKVGGNISVCQAEIRRRLWHTLVQIDHLGSFHIGLPSMISAIDSDTEYPRNLMDDDFYEGCLELPEGRPEGERTPIAYTLCKGRIIEVFGKIATLANRLSLPPYYEVVQLDGLLDKAMEKVPHFLRLTSLELAITESPHIIIQRFNVALLYHKCRCVLHRKYLLKERENPDYAHSKSGLGSALEILRYQTMINEAVQPGGRLSEEKWFLSSLSMHDFLLAGTIVYLSAVHSIVDGNAPSNDPALSQLISALYLSHSVWAQTSLFLRDSKKALDIIGRMLEKIRLMLETNSSKIPVTATHNNNNNGLMSELSLYDPQPPPIPDAYLYSMTSWPTINSTTDSTTDSKTPLSGLEGQLSFATSTLPDNIDNMLNMPVNFDWDIFDNHLRPQPNGNLEQMPFEEFDFNNNDYHNL